VHEPSSARSSIGISLVMIRKCLKAPRHRQQPRVRVPAAPGQRLRGGLRGPVKNARIGTRSHNNASRRKR
jgi:hypothetical protein